MSHPVEISICIPAYRNAPFLKRLLESIQSQTFNNYEIIITDDSPDLSVQAVVSGFSFSQPLLYYKNEKALGTPANWNEAMRHATGKWIKIMHHDDWFASSMALEEFMDAVSKNPSKSFFFSAFQNILERTGQTQIVRCTFWDLLFLKLSPLHLFKRVYVGNPSCVMVKRDLQLYYDERYKFVVDFEYYIRCFWELRSYKYIDKVLVNVGFHEEQVTRYTFLVPEVQIPENIILLNDLGLGILYNPIVYDYYWRMFRNLGIREASQLNRFYQGAIPDLLKRMISAQSRIPSELLRKGIISKVCMSLNYFASLFSRH